MQQATFFTLFLSLTALLAVIHSQTPAPTNCNQISTASCAACNSSPFNCRYVWTEPGIYNSSVNASCLPQSLVNQLLWFNEYSMTVYAYALKENEINTTSGQYLLSKRISSLNYHAYAVPCFDRNLCYCKKAPPPPPDTVVVTVYDCQTGLSLVGAGVNLTSANLTRPINKAVNSTGYVYYYPIQPGNYGVNAFLAGYYPNSTTLGSLTYNQTIYVQLCLTQVPCTVTVITYDSSTNLTLGGALVTLNSATLTPQTTPSSGQVTYTFNAGVASLATASKTGYSTAAGSFVCTRNGTVTVPLYLTPVPSRINVIVVDVSTLLPISSASVSLTGSATLTSGVNSSGITSFYPIGPGTYGATASASGYTTNSTSVGTLALNQTVTVTIYLAPLPCTLLIEVYDGSTNLSLPGAVVTLNSATSNVMTTDTDGEVTFAISYTAATCFNATLPGYTVGNACFTCARNASVTVDVPLFPVLNTLIVTVLDLRTLLPITTSAVTLTGPVTSTSGVNAAGSVTYPQVPKGTYNANASAAGYYPNSTLVGTVFANQTISAIIYLTEIPCTLTVNVIDLSTNASLSGAQVTVSNSSFPVQTTGSSGSVVYTFNYNQATGVSATKAGYSTGFGAFTCSRGGNATVTIYIGPILNAVLVQVIDIRTLLPITTATVALTSGGNTVQTSGVNGTAVASFGSVDEGTYGATASASGYNSNSTSIGMVTFNQTVFVIIYLAEIPCTVITTVYDTSTNATLNGAVVTLNGNLTMTTGANGQVTFSVFYNLANGVSATKVGYTTASSPLTCSRNGTVFITLYISPVLNQVFVQVIDITTLLPITTATVSLTSGGNTVQTSGVNGTAVASFGSVVAGTYSATASASGYGSNSTSVGTVTYNQTVFVIIYLGQLPCVVTITTYDISTNVTLPSTTITFTGVTTTSLTGSNGVLTTTFSNVSSAPPGFVASQTGYTSASATFTCGKNVTLNINVYLTPLPNALTVQVIDARTLLPITTASVTTSGSSTLEGFLTSTESVSANGTVFYTDVPAGTYSANASAPGYYPNSTTVGTVVRNQTLFAIIYLREQPCNLTVYVRQLSNNATLAGALTELNGGPYAPVIGNAQGISMFSIEYDLANSVNASLSGYSNGSADFQCSRGANLVVFIYLSQIFQVFVAAVDASTQGFPLIPSATILLGTIEVTQVSRANPAIHIQTVSSFPYTTSVTGIAEGFLSQTQSFTFTSTQDAFNISLIPEQFNLYFTPTELFSNGTTVLLSSTGLFSSGFVPSANYAYTPAPGTIGGSVDRYQNGSADVLSAFTPNINVNNATYFAAPFLSNVPTEIGEFYVKQTNLSTLAENYNDTTPLVFLQYIPPYASTPQRNLLIPLPYRRNAAFVTVSVNILNPNGSPAYSTSFLSVQLSPGKQFQTQNKINGEGAVFEFLINFGSTITNITIDSAGASTYNFLAPNAGWLDPVTHAVTSTTLPPFFWPTPALLAQLFTTTANGQLARLPNSKLYQVFYYQLVLINPTTPPPGTTLAPPYKK